MAERFLDVENSRKGGALTNVQKMECFLRTCANPGFQVGIGEELGIHRSTVSKTVHEIMNRVAAKCEDWISFPTTPQDIQSAKRKWQGKYAFPLCIGAIDCTHVPIQRPPERFHPDEFVNRKNFLSFNVQVTVDADELFTSVNAMWPGSVHDSRIFRNSRIPDFIVHTDALLLGDSGYALAPYIMTPYRNADTLQKRSFNRLFTKERVVVERVFGQLKRRFPVLSHPVRMKHEAIPTLILACCVLHNVSKFLDDPIEQDNYIEEQDVDEAVMLTEVEWPTRAQGQQKRDQLAQIIHQRLIDD